jgi:hypothetical protein
MTKLKLFAALLAGLLFVVGGPAQIAPAHAQHAPANVKVAKAKHERAAPPAKPAEKTPEKPVAPASADDTARFLAGMSLPDNSPLAPLADRNWQQHVRSMDQAFASVDQRQLSKARAWSAVNLPSPQPTLYYLFSGPDFLYADSFFPKASTVVMVGLEPPGEVPNLLALPPRYVYGALGAIQNSMRTLLQVTFFITNNMSHDLYVSELRGTLPVLYVFMARSGKHLRETTLVSLDDEGKEIPYNAKSPVRGAKITYTAGDDGKVRTLYYFSANLANDGLKKSGLVKFMDKLGNGDSMIKSASYLLHGSEFSMARDFLLAHSATLLEDDTGIPLRYFDEKKWDLKPFGRYLPPIPVFRYAYQQKMTELFAKKKAPAIDFGYGYHWTKDASNILVAVNNDVMGEIKAKAEAEKKAAEEKAAAEKAAAEKAAAEKAAAEKAAAEKAAADKAAADKAAAEKAAAEKAAAEKAAADKAAADKAAADKPAAPAATTAAPPTDQAKPADKPAEKPPQ